MLMMIIENLCAVDIKCYTAGSGQRELPRLVLEVGGTSTLQAAMPGKLKFPPYLAWLPAKLKSIPTSSTSLGGSRWPDPAV